MPHFFIKSDNVNSDILIINDVENYRHIARSLRAKVGEKLVLIDENQISYETVISEITTDKIVCNIVNSYRSERDLTFNLFLAQSPLRSDAQSIIIEKATELGIRGVYPIITDNCAVSKSISDKKIDKWQKIMYEASKQCERAKIPSCYPPTTLAKLLENNFFNKIIVCAERSTEITLKQYLSKYPILINEDVLVIIGPEGGFSANEFKFFKSKNLPLISLGDLILKAETAVITALGNVIYEYQG
ncbi:MAG: 16S rRNA (uracil(1498)-N(3))-methyltransferase [bacterium]|nr:16S rRNA (uracil(1498)-N(3))-methyltransferase [bacterium]